MRVKCFTCSSGFGSMILKSSPEDQVNDWLRLVQEWIVQVTQSESERPMTAHDTVGICYELLGAGDVVTGRSHPPAIGDQLASDSAPFRDESSL